MKDFLENIIKNIVQNPDQVKVNQEEKAGRLVLTISVADDDMGRVIGKEGKVINAIRMIMRVMAIRHDVRIRIDIEDRQGDATRSEIDDEPDATPASTPAPSPKTTGSVTSADIVGQPGTTVLDNTTTPTPAVPVTPVADQLSE